MTEYIEREAVLQKIREYRGFFQDNPSSDHMALKMEAENIVKDQESADVAPVVHGKWADCNWVYECDICSCQLNKGLFKANMRYCPNCGAKMDLEE